MSNVKVHNIFVGPNSTLGLRLIKKRKNVMMGRFLGSGLQAQNFSARSTDSSLKKCLRFFFLFELGFLYTTYFQKCLQFTRKATTTVLYNTLLQNTKYCVVFYFSFFTTECTIFTTLLKVHFSIQRNHIVLHCTLQMVLPNYDCHFDSAAISKNNPP